MINNSKNHDGLFDSMFIDRVFFVVDYIESNTTSIREPILNSEFEENLEHQHTKLSKQLRYCPAFENRIDHIIFLMTDSDVIQNFFNEDQKGKRKN